jgi:hypothetical protein
MTITKLPNGNLKMVASHPDRYRIRNRYQPYTIQTEQRFINVFLLQEGFTPIKPEACGALTDAPLITDGKDVWGFMDYAVRSFLADLESTGEAEWKKG